MDEMWEAVERDADLVRNSISLAKRDLKTSRNVFNGGDYDWCFSIAYNAMLQAGRALMFSMGYRPKGEYRHVAVVEFVKSRLGKSIHADILAAFGKMRKKRHVAVYEQCQIISEDEALNAMKNAGIFVEEIERRL